MSAIRTLSVLVLLGLPFWAVSQEHHGAQGDHGHANAHMNQRPIEELAASFDSPERAAWQRPDEVIALMGDLAGKTVMDIGSGTGYFSFRLVEAGAKVISADVDERFLGIIRDRMARQGLTGEHIELRHVPYDSSMLQPGEVDIALIVDTYHHIGNRVDYFAEVRAGLKPGGKLMVVDFFKRDDPVGPPVAMKMAAETIVAELREAGYTSITVNRELLPYQYVIEAF